MKRKLNVGVGMLLLVASGAMSAQQSVSISGTNKTADAMIGSTGVGLHFSAGGAVDMVGIYSGARNGLVRFDLGDIPAGSTFVSASLRVYRSSYTSGTAPLRVSAAQLAEGWVEGISGGTWDSIHDGATWYTRSAGTIETPVFDSGEGIYYVSNVVNLADDPVTNATLVPPRKFVRSVNRNFDNDPGNWLVSFTNCASLADLKAQSPTLTAYYYDAGASKLWLRTSTGLRWYATNELWATAGGTTVGVTTNDVVNPGGTTNGWYEWSVTSIVSNWLMAGQSNYGFRLVSASCELSLRASEGITNAPELIIHYISATPEVVNLEATGITANDAWLGGVMISTGKSQTVWGILWGTNNPGASMNGWLGGGNVPLGVAATEGATNSSQITGLVNGQTYYYSYWASNVFGASVDVPEAFIASSQTAPVIDNGGGATGVGPTNATLRGSVVTANPFPQVWFYRGTTDGGTTPGSWNQGVISMGTKPLGSFSTNVSGLLANKTYWYRVCASNQNGTVWSDASTNFTTTSPVLVIDDAGALEGAPGETNAITLRVSLTATSAVDVSVDYATADASATVADSDYTAVGGTVTVPAGQLTAAFVVQTIGDIKYETNENFRVNLSSPVNVTIGDSQAFCTITNDDVTLYVRGDGSGSDSNLGGSWSDAFATLQKALATVPYNTPFVINIQASTGSQSYAACSRTIPYDASIPLPTLALDVSFQGGWQDVGGIPLQTGMSVVKDASTNQPGIKLAASNHAQPRSLTVNRLSFADVTRGIEFGSGSVGNNSHVVLVVSNTVIRSKNEGIHIENYHNYGAGYAYARIWARDVDIVAGLGGAGHGIYIRGGWSGSLIDATPGAVSSITSSNGGGLYFSACTLDQPSATFSNLLVYGCSSNGIYLDALQPDYNGAITSNRVRGVFSHCTIVDNALDGLSMVSRVTGSYGNISNSIVANNGGAGVNLNGTSGVFTCAEGYNVLYGDDILTNGSVQSVAGTTAITDPLFYKSKTKPAPWYYLGGRGSPAFHSGSDGLNRGAYQMESIAAGFTLMVY